MSKKHRHRPYQEGERNVQTTVLPPTQLQETTMEVTSQKVTEPTKPTVEEPQGLTAKQMAKMEEENLARMLKLKAQQELPPPPPPPNVTDVVSQGFDALNEAWQQAKKHREVREYVPPPRTARQMTQLEEELEAGRRAGERARLQAEQAAQWRAANEAADRAKEGFTTPVYRPNDAVPDPITGKLGSYGSDA